MLCELQLLHPGSWPEHPGQIAQPNLAEYAHLPLFPAPLTLKEPENVLDKIAWANALRQDDEFEELRGCPDGGSGSKGRGAGEKETEDVRMVPEETFSQS